MGEPKYLLRLDDACPWMNRERWGRIEALLDHHGIRPIVAVVPRCADPELRHDSEDPDFWSRARGWRDKGWTLALHGFDHVFTGRAGGLVPLNRYTEFAGRPEREQRDKIRGGWQTMVQEQVTPSVWVAPAHSFDRLTLRVLFKETTIRIISDGLSSRPFQRFGFSWYPQQLWNPRSCPDGVWTLCLHPNELTAEFESRLDGFLSREGDKMVNLVDLPLPERRWGWTDAGFAAGFLLPRGLKHAFTRKNTP